MRSFVVAVALLACGCGEVLKVPDAAAIDAYVPDSPTMIMCGAGEMVCNGSCANLMTSNLYCGNCSTQCTPTQGCLNGSCVPINTSCSRVRDFDPQAMDGVYKNPNNNFTFFCSFTTSTQWEIVTNPYTAPPPGMVVARATEFADPNFTKAFIALYNHDVGHRAFSTFSFSNCCMGPVAGLRYSTGGLFYFVGQGTSSFCNTTVSMNTYLTFGPNGSGYMASLADNYFISRPVAEATGCSDSNNVAYWYKRTTF